LTETFMTGAEPDELWPLVKAHHYSRRMPAQPTHCYAIRSAGGLFGNSGEVIAGAIFGPPPARWAEEVIELSRLVRHPDCAVPLSKLIAFSCHWLKIAKHTLAISYADWAQQHHGGIYQACGWSYNGRRDRRRDGVLIDGKFWPARTCNRIYDTNSPSKLQALLPAKVVEPHYDEGKHLYWKPLMIAGRTQAKRLGLKSVAYPKPNAAGPMDAPVPTGASVEHPHAAAPNSFIEKPKPAKQEALL
jgi:hypothetical protein